MLDWLACTLVKILGGLLCHLPPTVAVWCGEQLGALAYWLQPKRTQIGLINLRAAFNGRWTLAQSRRIIRNCYKQLGAGMLELSRLPVIDQAYIERYVTIEGRRHFEDAIASGRPLIFLTGHYGSWELSSIVAALRGHPIVALARAQDNLPKLYRLLVSYRESKGCIIVHKGGAMKQLMAALEQRRPVGIVGDQASRQGILVEFLGRPALFATGPFKLAYMKDAVILSAFLHRVRGPYHRLVVEPPLELSHHGPKAEAIRHGVERFAALLSRHITEDPSQWLWMHKRWKHTPARRLLILSDGKAGHLKQSLAAVEAVRDRQHVSQEVVEVRYRHAWGRAVTLLWSWWMPARFGGVRCLQWALTPASAAALFGRYADMIVSCGSSTTAVNVLWAAENRAKSVVIMNPAPLPLHRFGLVIAPQHDGLPARPNVVPIVGALVRPQREAEITQAIYRLQAHPKFKRERAVIHQHPRIAVFLGGETAHYEISQGFVEALMGQVRSVCERVDGWYLVTTSRRTTPAVERTLSEQLSRDPRCRLLLIASRDPIDGTMDGMLGSADVAVVTGESISMVSESCASGRQVIVVEPPLRRLDRPTLTKHRRFLEALTHEAFVRVVPTSGVSVAIERTLKDRRPAKRLDNISIVRDAIARLL